jgi:hypothetical protein
VLTCPWQRPRGRQPTQPRGPKMPRRRRQRQPPPPRRCSGRDTGARHRLARTLRAAPRIPGAAPGPTATVAGGGRRRRTCRCRGARRWRGSGGGLVAGAVALGTLAVWASSRDGNGYKPAGFCRPKLVPVKNIYVH